MDPESDDEPALSSSALDALKEFYADRDARLKKFEDLKAGAEHAHAAASESNAPLSMEAFAEDWNESQFWYSDETATALAEELLVGVRPTTTIAVVSAPSVFVQLKNILANKKPEERPKIWLLEYDKRFAVFPEFVFYDFKTPFKLPPAMTVRWLSKSLEASSSRLIICTGERMETLITKVYRPQGVQTTTFLPVHSKGLSNEFFCYANFECKKWKFKEQGSHQSSS